MTIVEFLEARIAEDEEEARTFDWYTEHGHEGGADWELVGSPEYVTVYISPRRVLAESKAKRLIIAEWRRFDSDDQREQGYVIYSLAAIYSTHPDYDQAWKP